jgi:hypothetical protein
MAGLGLEVQRLRLVWASAAEGARLAGEFTSFVEEVRELGPLRWGAGGPISAGLRAVPPAEIAERVEAAIAATMTDAETAEVMA